MQIFPKLQIALYAMFMCVCIDIYSRHTGAYVDLRYIAIAIDIDIHRVSQFVSLQPLQKIMQTLEYHYANTERFFKFCIFF